MSGSCPVRRSPVAKDVMDLPRTVLLRSNKVAHHQGALVVQDEDERPTPPSVISVGEHRLPTVEPRDEKTRQAIHRVATTYPRLGRYAVYAEVRREVPDLLLREVNWVLNTYGLPNPR
jgi:hypothetical protein